MSYAVIKTGGKQYSVIEGQTLLIERLPDDVGATVDLQTLLLAGDGDAVFEGDKLSSAAVKAEIGDLGRVRRVVKVVGFVASTPDFTGQPGVVNGASELLGKVFGDAGVHARSAVGVAALPLDVPVEVEMIVEVD